MSDILPPTTYLVPQANAASPIRGDPARNAVPIPLTPLLGRDKVINHICALLDAKGTRLLTLTGPGGVGKTRLAIEVATRMAPVFAHGVYFVALDSIKSPEFVASTVAQVLGIQESGEIPLQDALVSVPTDRHLLLVLDNVEHVVSGVAPWLSHLVAEWPLLHVLVTSRVAVQIDGEQRFVVPPLPLPTSQTSDGLTDNPAVMLFMQRAQAVNPDFVLTTSQAGVVARICCRLDGLPLAIELAASRVTVLSPPAILARLNDRLALLKCNRRDAPKRHQTMRDAIAWSYDLLLPVEQVLFRRLGVFIGGFTVDAAEAVGGSRALDMLTILVDHSLVRHLPPPGEGARMEMYETIREFALEELIAHGEEAAVRDAHADYFLQIAVEAGEGTGSHARLEWVACLDGDQDNVRSAVNWLARRGRIEDALKLATDFMWFRWIQWLYTESLDPPEISLTDPQAYMRPGGRANAPGDIHESASLLEHLYRAKLATLEASSNDADLLSVARSALDNAVIAAELGAGRALYLEEAVREAIGYSSSQIAADAPGYPRLTDSSAGLTPRELDVLRLVADGLTNQEIADMLCISLRTVTSHITHVLTKLALTSRTAAVSHAIRHGLI